MPLFELNGPKNVVPFRQLRGGAELYESEIEDLLWDNFEDLIGESVFLVQRQATIPGGGRPDIVALDQDARVVVVEIKRDVDRGQLAQCLEYAGWARTTNLDELARMYHRTADDFFRDWQEYTETPAPMPIAHGPRLVLVAREFHGRTGSAFDFLIENGLPVKHVRISVYEDNEGRKFVDVEGEHEPDVPTGGGGSSQARAHWAKIDGRRVRLGDLVDAGFLVAGQRLVWKRPQLGHVYRATVTDDGELRLSDGRTFSAPSKAATEAASIPAYDGWDAWRVDEPGGVLLDDLRRRLVEQVDEEDGDSSDGATSSEGSAEDTPSEG